MNVLGNFETSDIPSRESLEEIIQKYARISNSIWYKLSKNVKSLNVPKHSRMRSIASS